MMVRDLYDVAREISHQFGYDWTDPRTGKTYKAKRKPATAPSASPARPVRRQSPASPRKA